MTGKHSNIFARDWASGSSRFSAASASVLVKFWQRNEAATVVRNRLVAKNTSFVLRACLRNSCAQRDDSNGTEESQCSSVEERIC
jgi:hypothetical protein